MYFMVYFCKSLICLFLWYKGIGFLVSGNVCGYVNIYKNICKG